MLTLKDLGIRTFKTDASGAVTSTSKADIKVSHNIKNEDFMQSKPFWTNSKIVSMNAHDIMQDIQNIVHEEYPSVQPWGNTYIYRDKVDIHGYVDTFKPNSPFPVLHPDVPISELAFSRVISRMHICGDDNYNTTVALKWEPKELQVAIGTNVRICDNFNIMGGYSGNILLKTNRSLTYENIRFELMSKIKGIEEHFGKTIEHINALISQPLNAKQIRFILGDLMVAYDQNQPVINYTDIHEISKAIVANEKNGKSTKNLWDLVNVGTDVLRFENNGGDTSFENIQSWNNYCDGILSIGQNARSAQSATGSLPASTN